MLDKGVGVKYFSMKTRLTKMAHAIEYAGNLEIMAVTYIMKLYICIYEDGGNDFNAIAVIPTDHYSRRTPVRIQYKMDTAVVAGHYNLIVPFNNKTVK